MAIVRQYVLDFPPLNYRFTERVLVTSQYRQQSTDNQSKLQSAFKAAMLKLSVLGHDINNMVDCSEVIPVPPPFTGHATLPAGISQSDVEQAVSDLYTYFRRNYD